MVGMKWCKNCSSLLSLSLLSMSSLRTMTTKERKRRRRRISFACSRLIGLLLPLLVHAPTKQIEIIGPGGVYPNSFLIMFRLGRFGLLHDSMTQYYMTHSWLCDIIRMTTYRIGSLNKNGWRTIMTKSPLKPSPLRFNFTFSAAEHFSTNFGMESEISIFVSLGFRGLLRHHFSQSKPPLTLRVHTGSAE